MKIVVSSGDINGIGLEIFYKAMKYQTWEGFNFTLVCNKDTLDSYFQSLNFEYQMKLNEIQIGGNLVSLLHIDQMPNLQFGQNSQDSGLHSIASLDKAVMLLKANEVDAIVTLPISKESCALANWNYPGHTEYFAENFKSNYMMVLTDLKLFVALATIHIPLSKVSSKISKELIIEKVSMLNSTLINDVGISKPRIAVLGLNPHAGENGNIGKEEIEIINPAIADLKLSGIEVEGSYPADGFFAAKLYENYDGVLAMYHDQGLIPLKMLAFPGGVNFTAGLPIIRTSPDHGTAFGIVGKNIASAQSLIDSISLAATMHSNRSK